MAKGVEIRELNKHNIMFFRNTNLKKPTTKFDLMLFKSKDIAGNKKHSTSSTTEHLYISIKKGWNHLMFSDDGSITLY